MPRKHRRTQNFHLSVTPPTCCLVIVYAMKAMGFSTFLARIDAAEYGICRRMNFGASLSPVRLVFQLASKLGDGPAWYALIVGLPVLFGHAAVRPALLMALTSLVGVALYTWLKRTFVRERPFITHTAIARAAAPLDRYSFPSGHTLHAVSLTWQAVAHFGELGWVLVPFATLIAASRVVLGLHYPTDVLVGALLGTLLAQLGLAFS